MEYIKIVPKEAQLERRSAGFADDPEWARRELEEVVAVSFQDAVSILEGMNVGSYHSDIDIIITYKGYEVMSIVGEHGEVVAIAYNVCKEFHTEAYLNEIFGEMR